MERFHYNMRCRTKDYLILEDIYDQLDSDYYISWMQNWQMSHWAALSVFLMLVLHILQEKIILEFGETHISINTDRIFISNGNSYCCKCKLLVRHKKLGISVWTRYR